MLETIKLQTRSTMLIKKVKLPSKRHKKPIKQVTMLIILNLPSFNRENYKPIPNHLPYPTEKGKLPVCIHLIYHTQKKSFGLP